MGMNEILHVCFTFFIALDMIRYMGYPQNCWIVKFLSKYSTFIQQF